ncbi:MAG: hypothetical protein WB676_03455, partial [Bryobacteraceae bacterium]
SMGREHYQLVNALQNLEEPEFSSVVRKTLSGFASRWLSIFADDDDQTRQVPPPPTLFDGTTR